MIVGRSYAGGRVAGVGLLIFRHFYTTLGITLVVCTLDYQPYSWGAIRLITWISDYQFGGIGWGLNPKVDLGIPAGIPKIYPLSLGKM